MYRREAVGMINLRKILETNVANDILLTKTSRI